MSGLREIGRPMLASIFVVQGLDTFQHPEKVAARAEAVVRPLSGRIPAVPAETEQAVRINGAVQAAAGTMLGLGILPRLSALAIAGTLVPTTLAGHRFWEADEPAERAQQRIHFLKNLAMLGGLLIAAADTGGAPSLGWRRRQAARRANGLLAEISQAVTGTAATAGERLSGAGHTAADSIAESAATVSERLADATHTAAVSIAGTAAEARDRLPQFSQAAADSARTTGSQLAQAAQAAGAQMTQAAQAAAEASRAAADAGRARVRS